MLLIDRYILARFLVNFVMLLTLLFIFAVAVDVILHLDDFVDAAREAAGDHAGGIHVFGSLVRLVFDFQTPHIFQFYAYLHGLVAIGAMGFTLAQMVRYRELVAIMASGVSLKRLAMPFVIAAFGLNVLQLLNQELLLPRVAPLLLRDKNSIGRHELDSFPVRFTPDRFGALLQAPDYDPQTQVLKSPTILVRDERGRTTRRITASAAAWDAASSSWRFTNGWCVFRDDAPGAEAAPIRREAIESYQTDLTPQVLMVRRYNEFASMLSLSQISEMLSTPSFTQRNSLMRFRYARFSSVLVNLLVLAMALPTFLLREPANLLRQSVICACLAIPAIVGSAIGMMVDMPGIPPAVGVFLPAITLVFMSAVPWTSFKT